MSNEKNTRIVRGEARFAGSANKEMVMQPLLSATRRNLIQGDRNLVLDLREQFAFEREYCTIYRPYGKIDVLFNNIITGETADNSFMKSMYFLPDWVGCPIVSGVPPATCLGLPPAEIFSFIPERRYGISTTPFFEPLLAYQDTWMQYISYISGQDSGQTMEYYTDYATPSGIQFVAGDGIPFQPLVTTVNGHEVLQIITPVEHGLIPGEHIEMQSTAVAIPPANLVIDVPIVSTFSPVIMGTTTPAPPQNTFTVSSLGNGLANSEKFIINIQTTGLDVTSIPTNPVGTLKRIINLDNLAETRSEYYTHIHTLITHPNQYTLDRTGFERGIFDEKGRVFQPRRTHDAELKTVRYQEYNSYLWNTNGNINVDMYYDNLNRPISDLYLTILTTNKNLIWDWDVGGNFSPAGYGWGWNFRKNGVVDPFVDNSVHPVNLTQNGNLGVDPLPATGHTLRGAFVEYNPFELKERRISDIGHSLQFNRNTMYKSGGTPYDFVESIFKYQPHHRISIKKFSNYISYNDSLFTSPQYAVYSLSETTFRWREILPIEFYEDDTNGVSYPYLNDAHYPYFNLEFKIEAVGPALIPLTSASVTILSEYTDGCQ